MVSGSHIYWELRKRGMPHQAAFNRVALTMAAVTKAQSARHYKAMRRNRRYHKQAETFSQATNRTYGYII